jgi:hypothetical protein
MGDSIRQRVGRPGPEHEALWKLIQDMVREEIASSMPTVGTVEGDDGGKVRVHLDDEDEPRTLGFPRKKGQRYQKGERVAVMRTRAGDHIVLGSYTSGQGKDAENAVGSPDIYDRAIGKNHMQSNSVGTEQIESNSVQNGHIKDNEIAKGKLDKSVQSTLSDSASKDYVNSKTSDMVKSGDLAKNATGKDALATEPWVKDQKYATSSDLNSLEKSLKTWVQDNFAKKKQ